MLKKTMSRREMFKKSAIFTGMATAYAGLPGWMPRLAFAQPYNDPPGDILVSVFLRGGADFLNMIVPYAEDAYYEARPQIAIPRPDDNAERKVLDLDGFFGLHPSLETLLPIFQGGEMTAVHATGSPHETRSHFEAMDFMERGTPGSYDLRNGWIGRHLATIETGNTSPIRGIGWGTSVQMQLVGAPSVVSMKSIIDYHLQGDVNMAMQMMESLKSLYEVEEETLQNSAIATQDAINLVASVGYENYAPQNGAVYPETDFAMALRQTAALIRADVGLEAACVDLGGWDTHVNQGGAQGTQANLMNQLSQGLAAFHQDLGVDMNKVTVVVMSEFGRQLKENSGRGTDHGHGGAMLVMGGNVVSTPVVTKWPTLAPEALDRNDLAITIDYRDVLVELLGTRLKNPTAETLFPNHNPQSVGVFTI